MLCLVPPLSLAISLPAQAEAPPSQQLPSDPEAPYYRLGLSGEALEALLSRYGLRVERTLSRRHAIWGAAAWEQVDDGAPLSLRLGYHLWFLADGLDGFYVGPSLGFRFSADRFGALAAGLEAGYQRIWIGLLFAFGAAAELNPQRGIAPRLRVALGYAWY